jgi:hypothetical protein
LVVTIQQHIRDRIARGGKMRFRHVLYVFLFCLALLLAGKSSAQTSQGRISGQVTDSSGGVVANATVTIENLGTHVKRVLRTNGVGEYVAPGIEPGFYSITVEVPGFKKVVRERVQIEVANDLKIDFEVQAGAVTEVVEVKAEAPLTETSNAVLSGVLSNQAINELPLQGRDFQNLLPLHPGVQRTPGGGFHSTTSNGNRPDDNNYIIDGATDNDAYYGETVFGDAGISGTPASILPLDAIQEFSTQEQPQADFGAKPGVVVNIGIKSGTNDIHGTAYYFHRNVAFDARNFFNPSPQPVAALLLHQFGASIGGPVRRDKWFYFASYEGVRDKVGNPAIVFTPVTASIGNPNVSIPDALHAAGCDINRALCNPLSLKLLDLKLFLPNPGFTASTSDPTAINFNFNNTSREDNLILKTDYHPGISHTISARFLYANTTQVEEDANPLRADWLSGTSPHSQVFGIAWVWMPNSRWVNEARFSYNRFWEQIAPVDHTMDPAKLGIVTGIVNPRLFGFPSINIDSTDFDSMGGNSSWPLETTPSHTENYADTVSYTAGKHTLRFGGLFSNGGVNYFRARNGRGSIDFASLADFLAGNVQDWSLLYGDPARNVTLKSFGFFGQDDYRIARHVTLNLGLRWDIARPIKDSRNLLANFIQTAGIVQVGRGIDAPYSTNYHNVSPRLGVAWDVFGTGKTVLRAGGGLIFTQPSIRTFMFSGGGLNENPSGLAGVTPGNGTITTFSRSVTGGAGLNWGMTNGPIFDLTSTAANTCSATNPCTIFGVDPHLKTPYVANWNVSVQQALTPTTLLQVAYVAQRGIKLYSVRDINQADPAVSGPCITATGNFSGCEQAARPFTTNCPISQGGLGNGGPCFPYIGFLNFLGNDSSSTYQSLQATLTKRYAHGLYLLAGYTYAHAIDTATTNLGEGTANSQNYRAERGNGDYDIRHRFTLSATYELPSLKTKAQLLEGWQVTGIALVEGGEPFTLGDFADDISGTGEFNDRWNIVGNPGNIKTQLPGNVIPFFSDGTTNPACLATATTPALVLSLQTFGCYQEGNTVLVPPALFTFGNMGRNIFRGPKFVNVDFSAGKSWRLSERFKLQLRAEVFNIFNHPNFDIFTIKHGLSSPSKVGVFRFTPDVGESNPVIGSGGSRHIQLGVKLVW